MQRAEPRLPFRAVRRWLSQQLAHTITLHPSLGSATSVCKEVAAKGIFMKLFLIRHAETEHNVAGLLAGATDSALTNHGVLQTQRLSKYLIERYRFTRIFSSDLRRAYMTAKAIEDAQKSKYTDAGDISVIQLEDLREQDFGSFECLPWSPKRSEFSAGKLPKPEDVGFKPKETSEAMAKRADIFLDDYIMPQLATDEEQEGVVAVVSHGLILAVLWKSLLARFRPNTVVLSPDITGRHGSRPLEHLPGWSNTGYLEIDLTRTLAPDGAPAPLPESFLPPAKNQGPTRLPDWKMTVRNLNSKAHLGNLKRTRGGVGSSTYDVRQKNLEGYFKKPKVALQD